MTRADFIAKCIELCPHCAAGNMPIHRASYDEYEHRMVATVSTGVSSHSSTLCHANQFRRDNPESGLEG